MRPANHLWLSYIYWPGHAFRCGGRHPLLVLPGPLLLLALFRYRDRDAHLLLLSAILPQRWFFDTFTLWLIPRSRREIVWTVFFSWGTGIWRWYHLPRSFTEVGRWTVVLIYLPMLIVILLRKKVVSKEASNQALTPAKA